jgi:hypothetical protein
MNLPGPFSAPPMPQNEQQVRLVSLMFLALWMIALLFLRRKVNSSKDDRK